VRADEDHAGGLRQARRREQGEGVRSQPQVRAAPVGLGAGAFQQSRVGEDLDVVRDEVGRHGQVVRDLARRGVTEAQRVDDRQARGVAEGGVDPCPLPQRRPTLSAH
jgi:hypothetical protein